MSYVNREPNGSGTLLLKSEYAVQISSKFQEPRTTTRRVLTHKEINDNTIDPSRSVADAQAGVLQLEVCHVIRN